jgi:hypothetical protein
MIYGTLLGNRLIKEKEKREKESVSASLFSSFGGKFIEA